jgi:hypothetical protein
MWRRIVLRLKGFRWDLVCGGLGFFFLVGGLWTLIWAGLGWLPPLWVGVIILSVGWMLLCAAVVLAMALIYAQRLEQQDEEGGPRFFQPPSSLVN